MLRFPHRCAFASLVVFLGFLSVPALVAAQDRVSDFNKKPDSRTQHGRAPRAGAPLGLHSRREAAALGRGRQGRPGLGSLGRSADVRMDDSAADMSEARPGRSLPWHSRRRMVRVSRRWRSPARASRPRPARSGFTASRGPPTAAWETSLATSRCVKVLGSGESAWASGQGRLPRVRCPWRDPGLRGHGSQCLPLGRWTKTHLGTLAELDQGFVYSLAFTPDGGRLMTGDNLGVVRLWDVRGRRLLGRAPAWNPGGNQSPQINALGR